MLLVTTRRPCALFPHLPINIHTKALHAVLYALTVCAKFAVGQSLTLNDGCGCIYSMILSSLAAHFHFHAERQARQALSCMHQELGMLS